MRSRMIIPTAFIMLFLCSCSAEKPASSTTASDSVSESISSAESFVNSDEASQQENESEISQTDIEGSTDTTDTNLSSGNNAEDVIVKITVEEKVFEAELADNSSAKAFAELLKQGAVTVNMTDYGNFEKVGPLPQSLPQNNEQITTEPGDIILYLGNSITIYYDTNSWNFTRLGKIKNTTQEELINVLGKGDVTVTFSVF